MTHTTRFIRYFCGSLLGFWLATGAVQAQKLSRQQMLEDVASLQRILLKVHPAPDAYISKDSIRSLLNQLRQWEADSIHGRVWELQIRQLLVQVGCGHTYLSQGYSLKNKRTPYFLPFSTYTNEQGVWVLNAADSLGATAIAPGSRILSINGVDAAEIQRKLLWHQPSDGYNLTFRGAVLNKELLFNYLYARYFTAQSRQRVTWMDKDGKMHAEQIWCVPASQLKFRPYRSDSLAAPLYQTGKGAQQFFYYPDRKDIGVLKIKSFSEGNGTKLYKKAVKSMRKNKTPYLVVDVRGNTGGSFSNSVNLVRHFVDEPFRMKMHRRLFRSWRDQHWTNHPRRVGAFMLFDVLNLQPRWMGRGQVTYWFKFRPYRKAYRFKGQVYVLTDGLSFSASSQAATYLKSKTSAVFIGDETGGGARANNGMQIPEFRLKGSGIRVKVPQMHIDYRLGADEGRGVMPNIPIRYEVSDMLEGRDLEWEAVLKSIEQMANPASKSGN